MKNLPFLIFIFFILSCSFSFNEEENLSKKNVMFNSSEVIYGTDDRVEIDNWSGEGNAKELSKAVLSLYRESGSNHEFSKIPSPLCEGEPFRKQPREALCTGVLIAPDIVLTAGHCFKKNSQCKNRIWKFDYQDVEDPSNFNSEVGKKLYRCSYIIRPKGYYQNKNLDFVFVKLTEPILERGPIPLEKGLLQAEFKNNEQIFAIGNPSGFPLKVMKGEVTNKNEGKLFFKTNIDSYRGNSGAPVFTQKESRLIGLLVSGEKDYEFDKLRGCYYSRKCSEQESLNCSGEKVISISQIKESYKWALEKRNNVGRKLFSHFDNFEKACLSDELNAKSKYFLSLLEEKTRSQSCSVIKERLERARYLDLNSSFIEDSSALSFFDNLEFLNLEENDIKDFEFLNSFRNLQLLYLRGNRNIHKINTEHFKNLKKLSFSNGGFFVGSLKNMRKLSYLYVDNIETKILSSIRDLRDLKELKIEESNLSSGHFLSGLSALKKLSLKRNKLKETLFISKIQTLRTLDISQNLIEDLSPLYSLEELYSFNAEGNPIKNCPLDALSFPLREFCEKKLGL